MGARGFHRQVGQQALHLGRMKGRQRLVVQPRLKGAEERKVQVGHGFPSRSIDYRICWEYTITLLPQQFVNVHQKSMLYLFVTFPWPSRDVTVTRSLYDGRNHRNNGDRYRSKVTIHPLLASPSVGEEQFPPLSGEG